MFAVLEHEKHAAKDSVNQIRIVYFHDYGQKSELLPKERLGSLLISIEESCGG